MLLWSVRNHCSSFLPLYRYVRSEDILRSRADESTQSEAVVVKPLAHLLGLANKPGLGLANAFLPVFVCAIFQDELITMVWYALGAYGWIILMSWAVLCKARCCLHGQGCVFESIMRSLWEARYGNLLVLLYLRDFRTGHVRAVRSASQKVSVA